MKSPLAFIVETKWTDAGKKIAHKAFDLAFHDRRVGSVKRG